MKKILVMEGTVIIPTNELRRIIRDEVEAAMQIKKSVLLEEQKKNTRYYLEEAAEYLHMAVPTLRFHRSKVGGTKIGKRWTFTKEELDRFIDRHRTMAID